MNSWSLASLSVEGGECVAVFGDLTAAWKDLVLTFFMLINVLQCFYLLVLLWYGQTPRAVAHGLVTAIFFGEFYALCMCAHGWQLPVMDTPVVLIGIFLGAAVLYLVYVLIEHAAIAKNTLSRASIKKSFDSMPSGVCFFDRDGTIVLCNVKMYELSERMIGREIQQMEELVGALVGADRSRGNDRALYRFPNGEVWEFATKDIETDDDLTYVQYVATDLTELYTAQQKLKEGNEALQKSIAQVNRIAGNVAEITRQQELLSAKMRVHNKMGNCMLAARQYSRVLEAAGKTAEKEELISLWKDSLQHLQNEVMDSDETDACEEVIRIARTIGVDVVIHGKMPANEEMAYLFVSALRECVTNARNHAGGTKVELRITNEKERITAVFTNNGISPKEPIVEGGGLSSLRGKVEAFGAKMTVLSDPEFALIITCDESIEETI